MKLHFQCAEQAKSPSNLTKYCARHEILRSTFQRRIPELLPPIERRFDHIPKISDDNPTISEYKIVISHPPLRRPSWFDFGDDFVLKNITFRAPAISQDVTKCCACHEKSHSNFTKYCVCHAKLNWALTWLSCYLTELLRDWIVTWLNYYLIQLLCVWAVTWLNSYFAELYFTELLFYWTIISLKSLLYFSFNFLIYIFFLI